MLPSGISVPARLVNPLRLPRKTVVGDVATNYRCYCLPVALYSLPHWMGSEPITRGQSTEARWMQESVSAFSTHACLRWLGNGANDGRRYGTMRCGPLRAASVTAQPLSNN